MVLGGLVLAFSLFLSVVAIGNTVFHLKYFGVVPGSGRIGTMLSILFLGGIQLICMGLLGEYIGRIYDEVRRRPLYLLHKVHRSLAAPYVVLLSTPKLVLLEFAYS